ncbi:MAG: hypothetical protein RL766_1218, partial [Bacteroidota bacterium]
MLYLIYLNHKLMRKCFVKRLLLLSLMFVFSYSG